jgi:phosphoglycolate phosphatase
MNLIFDFDGVVADSLDIFQGILFNVAGINEDTFFDLFDDNMYEGLAKQGIPEEEIPQLIKRLQEAWIKELDKVIFFPGIAESLTKLSSKYNVFIVSASPTRIIESLLNKFGLNLEVIGADKGTSKVDRINKIKQKHPGQSFYIGDTKGDMLEGHEAGVKTVAVTWGWHDQARLESANPDYVVHTPEELADMFLNMNQ